LSAVSASTLLKQFEELVVRCFHFSENTFDTIPISMRFISETEVVTTTGVFRRVRAVNKKHSVIDVVFLAEFSNERMSDYVVRRRFKLCVE